MSHPKLIIVHGMGQQSEDSFKDEFIKGCKWAFDLYPGFSGKSPEDYAEIVPVCYNDIFDQHRQRMANNALPVVDRLKSIPGMGGDTLLEAVKELTNLESQFSNDKFFETHWLDVLFYRFTTLGEVVRIRLGKKIAHEIGVANGGSKNVHILAHSLGTAVTHDCLAKLYKPEYKLGDLNNLSNKMHKLGSVHMVANTSRVLQSFINVDQSPVKPGDGGCTFFYREYRHLLDPITWPKSFNPTNNQGWITNKDWRSKRYQLVHPTSITNQHGNTHSIQHYLANPAVHLELFEKVFKIKLTAAQKKVGDDAFVSLTLKKVADDLQNSLENLKTLNIENVTGLIKAANTLKDFIEQLGGEYRV